MRCNPPGYLTLACQFCQIFQQAIEHRAKSALPVIWLKDDGHSDKSVICTLGKLSSGAPRVLVSHPGDSSVRAFQDSGNNMTATAGVALNSRAAPSLATSRLPPTPDFPHKETIPGNEQWPFIRPSP